MILAVAAIGSISSNFSKAKAKFCLYFYYSSDISYLSVGEKICNFKGDNENANFLAQLVK